MPHYRKKPVTIEAIQYTEENVQQVLNFAGSYLPYVNDNGQLIIPTLEGDMKAEVGDYIIEGVHGEFYPCKPDIFKETYESTEEEI